MPQASDELRAKMEEYFGEAVTMSAPLAWLLAHGWTNKDGMLTDNGKPYEDITQKEWDCSEYLCQEWDFIYDPG